ncbi:MAG: hypothetical protein MJZ77_02220 [Bacteroidales bacterium]|nr:hypothetical protein [Bacteroidales bacterium]
MKKVLLGLAAMAMMGMMMTSCQKDEGLSKDTFTATTENGNSKTHLDGLNLKWDDEGESIMVMGSNYQRAEYFAISVTNDNTCATFACQEGEEVDADAYQIYYPASMVTANGTIELPVEQEYAENNVKGFPMYAETQGHAFQFTNLCGLFRLQLQKDDVVVRSISITTDKGVNGAFAVSTSAAGAFQFEAYTANDDAQKTVTLDCGNGVSIDELTDFNIYLPAGTYSTFDITITATDGSKCVKSLNGNAITINRNERVTLTREGDALTFIPKDVINGLFSVSRDRVVYFAKGNLQNINGEWRFAEHQYDYLGAYSATEWDLFGWSGDDNYNYGMSTSYVDSPYYGSFANWGTQIGDGEAWETLSVDEWAYVLNSRGASKKGLGTVTVGTNEIHGLILLPDAWTLPAGLRFDSGTSSWTQNRYTAAQWEQMEAAGAVFLPAAGYRFYTRVGNSGAHGYYWSSTPQSENTAYNMGFSDSNVDDDANGNRNLGFSVRLVQDYQGN